MSHLPRDTWSTCSGLGTQLKPCDEESDVLDTLTHQQKLEDLYCNDFICCGKYWTDLHTLLEHCEDHSLEESRERMLDSTDAPLPFTEDNFDEDDEDEIPTPLSPGVAPQHLSNINLPISQTIVAPKSVMHAYGTQEEYGYEKIKEWMHQAQLHLDFREEERDNTPRPYQCQVRGCDKAYKNINGLKYHKRHGCCENKSGDGNQDEHGTGNQKPFRCSLGNCRKRYKNLNGLKYHIQHGHFKHRRSSTSSSSSSGSSLTTPPGSIF